MFIVLRLTCRCFAGRSSAGRSACPRDVGSRSAGLEAVPTVLDFAAAAVRVVVATAEEVVSTTEGAFFLSEIPGRFGGATDALSVGMDREGRMRASGGPATDPQAHVYKTTKRRRRKSKENRGATAGGGVGQTVDKRRTAQKSKKPNVVSVNGRPRWWSA